MTTKQAGRYYLSAVCQANAKIDAYNALIDTVDR